MRSSTSVRVGLSSLGLPFTSPTGVVDHAFRRPGPERRSSIYTSIDMYGAVAIEDDATLPFSEQLSVNVGLAAYSREYENATDLLQHVENVSVRWRPIDTIDIVPFWIRSDVYDGEIGPVYAPAGNFAPPTPGRNFTGPQGATYEGTAINYSVLSDVVVSDGCMLRGGLFRSLFDDKQDFANLMQGVTPEGDVARHTLIADPASKIASTSGELRSTHRFATGDVAHFIHASLSLSRPRI